MDQGKDKVVEFISAVVFPKLDMGWFDHLLDHKTELQEYLQQNGDCKIEYKMLDEKGPDNDKTYTMAVYADGKKIGEGVGSSKKNAEQAAAYQALKVAKQ